MFENLSDRLGGVFDRLTKQGALTEDDVTAAMREVRVALLEADVSLPVARNFVKAVTSKATGSAVTKCSAGGSDLPLVCHPAAIRVSAFSRLVAQREQRAIGGAGRGCAADRPLR